jgi:hypothetical protein
LTQSYAATIRAQIDFSASNTSSSDTAAPLVAVGANHEVVERDEASETAIGHDDRQTANGMVLHEIQRCASVIVGRSRVDLFRHDVADRQLLGNPEP